MGFIPIKSHILLEAVQYLIPNPNPELALFCEDLLSSYAQCFGQPLVSIGSSKSVFDQLFHAPFVLLSHGVQAEPIFNFGNQKALSLWELSWEELTRLPSRCSAEVDEQTERQRLLDDVAQKGYSEGYRGVRISSRGRRFFIEQAKIWNIHNKSGQRIGQGACFSQWTDL